MDFYKNLEKQMQIKKITAYQIAKNTNISNSTITDWKKGKMPSAEKIIELVRYLEISADELLGTNYSNSYTKEERQLIEYFRNCSEGNKQILLNAAQGLSNQNVKPEPEEKSSTLKIG